MAESLSIPARFNGPLESGNGGYCSGLLAGFLDDGPVEANLRRPVPLDIRLDVLRDDGSVRLLADGRLTAEARSVPEVGVEPPEPATPAEARRATARYQGQTEGIFSRCFVCGRARHDALGVFAGPVEGRQAVASPWTPPPWTTDPAGQVLPEFVWSVLDCPTYHAAYMNQALPTSFLVRLTAQVTAPIVAGEEHVVMAWPLGTDGRKRHAGSAVVTPDGRVLATASALMVEPRQT